MVGGEAGGRSVTWGVVGQVRCKDLKAARGLYGRAIGTAPKERVFKSYIELELQMGNIDRVGQTAGPHPARIPGRREAWGY